MTWIAAYVWLGWVIRVCMVPTVLRRQFTPGASLAWLGIIFLHPYIGLLLYMLVGERRLGRGREALHRELIVRYRAGDAAVLSPAPANDPADDAWAAVALQAQKVGHMPVIGGNDVQFISDSAAMVDQLVADIQGAKSSVHLLYYIFCPDTTGRRVSDALVAAVGRGVTCRVLADEFASRVFFRRGGLAAQLRQQGVKVTEALPSSPLRRRDLRNHRKLSIIDGAVAYAGSQNLINADYGGRHGGPWYDLTGRFTGPVLREFAALFAEDWAFETNEMLDPGPAADAAAAGSGTRMQVVPSGPVTAAESYRRVLLGAIQSATRRIVITTPYFVPDDPALVGILMAADRGVDVTLILPQTPDHFFTAAAGRSHYCTLLESGVSIHLYQPGLIHSKTTVVDDKISLFGSANLDVRSFNLNFELSVFLYGREVTDRLHAIQMDYLKQSLPLDLESWSSRSALKQTGDCAVALLSPLL